VSRPTIKDVALRAGVTFQTVSRALNGTGEISESTRRRVRRAAEELNYRPSLLARSLRQQRTATIGLIVWSFDVAVLPLIVKGVHDAARASDYDLLFANVEDLREERRYLNLLYSKHVDGIIVISKSLLDVDNDHIRGLDGLPCVLVNRGVPEPTVDSIHWDNEAGAYRATSYVIALGHRRIAYVSGSEDRRASHEELTGYRRAMQQAGLDNHVQPGASESELAGRHAAEALLALQPRPTAIIADDDTIAIGVLAAARQFGLVVPDDLAVVGQDDTILAAHSAPPLTSVTLPTGETGTESVRLLLEQINGSRTEPVHLVLPRDLLVRESCGGGPRQDHERGKKTKCERSSSDSIAATHRP